MLGRSWDFFAPEPEDPTSAPTRDYAPRCRYHGGYVKLARRAKGPGEVTIETPRLVLRRYHAADFDTYLKICADPEMSCYSGRPPPGPEETWARLLRNVGHWAERGYGFFAVEEKATGCLVGEAGLADFHRQLGPEFDRAPEVGWAIAPAAQRQGYATEATAAALGWIEALFGIDRTVCIIHCENQASIRVAEKLGYVQFGERNYRGYRGLTFERLRS